MPGELGSGCDRASISAEHILFLRGSAYFYQSYCSTVLHSVAFFVLLLGWGLQSWDEKSRNIRRAWRFCMHDMNFCLSGDHINPVSVVFAQKERN